MKHNNPVTHNILIDTVTPNNPNWPSRTGNPSGPGRGNAPAKGK